MEIRPGNVRERLRRALPRAIKARDAVAVAALRAALAAIDNAEAMEAARRVPPVASHPALAGTLVGLGAGEVERRVLTDAQMEAIVRAEVGELRATAEAYRRAGQASGRSGCWRRPTCSAPISTARRRVLWGPVGRLRDRQGGRGEGSAA